MGKAKGSMCVRLLFSEGRAQQKSILASLIILRKLINQKFELVSQTCFQTYLLCCLLCIFWHKLNLAPAGRKCPGPRQKLVWKWHRVANEVYHRHNCRTWNDNSYVRSRYPQEFMIDTTKEVQIVYNNLDWLITARKHEVKQKQMVHVSAT